MLRIRFARYPSSVWLAARGKTRIALHADPKALPEVFNMPHTSFVQPSQVEAVSRDKGTHTSQMPIGLLGCDEQYAMPCAVLEALAGHVGGIVVTDLPPFFVACKDGLVLVMTLVVGEDYVGSAFVLTAEDLERTDPCITEMWDRAPKAQTAEEFFRGTAFGCTASPHSFPEEASRYWRFSSN